MLHISFQLVYRVSLTHQDEGASCARCVVGCWLQSSPPLSPLTSNSCPSALLEGAEQSKGSCVQLEPKFGGFKKEKCDVRHHRGDGGKESPQRILQMGSKEKKSFKVFPQSPDSYSFKHFRNALGTCVPNTLFCAFYTEVTWSVK